MKADHETTGVLVKLRYFYPLAGFVIPTLVIGFGFVIPRSCIAGINDLTVGFATTVAGACATYFFGVRAVAHDLHPRACGLRRSTGPAAHHTAEGVDDASP